MTFTLEIGPTLGSFLGGTLAAWVLVRLALAFLSRGALLAAQDLQQRKAGGK